MSGARGAGATLGATLAQFAGRIGSGALALAALGVAARALPTAAFGRLTFYLALFAILGAVADFGSMTAGVRRAATDPERAAAVIGSARRFRLATSAAAVAAVGGVASAYGEARPLLFVLASLPLLGHALAPLAVPLHVGLAFGRLAAARLVGAAFALAATASLALAAVAEAAAYLAAFALATPVANAVAALLARRRSLDGGPRSDPGFLRESAALGAGALCRQVYFHFDSFFLRAFAGERALALFNAPLRLLGFAAAVPAYAGAAALPLFSRYERHDPGAATALARRLAAALGALAVFGGAVTLLAARPILRLAFGEELEAAAPTLRWLAGAGFAVFLGSIPLHRLIAQGRARSLLALSAGALALRALLDAALVPPLAERGAAIACVATEASIALGASLLLLRNPSAHPTAAVPRKRGQPESPGRSQ